MKKIWLIGILIVLFAGAGWASYPYQVIKLQGRLTDRAGMPRLSGIYTMTFSIYASADAVFSASLWRETGRPVVVEDNGIFNVYLGQTNPIELIFDPAKTYYVGVKVDDVAETEMTPRRLLAAVPFAVTARYMKGGSVEAYGERAVAGKYSDDTFGFVGLKYTGPDGSAQYRGLYGYSTAEIGWGAEGVGSLGGIFGISETGTGVGGISGSISAGVWGYNIKVAGGGPGVKGQSDNNYGVHGISRSNQPAVYGENMSAEAGVRGRSVSGVGVWGHSELTAGLSGLSNKDSYFRLYSTSGTPEGAVVGWGRRSLIGVHGKSKSNYGVLGSSEADVGVYGTGSKEGVRGESNFDRGVIGVTTGTNKAGVAGLSGTTLRRSSVDAGVYGESSGGEGVVGVSNATNEAGVVGLENLDSRMRRIDTGVHGESSSGYGVFGYAPGTIYAGVFAQNEAGGVALEIGPGAFKVGKYVAAYTLRKGDIVSCTMNEVRGVFTFTPAGETGFATVEVTCPHYSPSNSMIIADDNNSTACRIVNPRAGGFDIQFNVFIFGGIVLPSEFKFMVIN